MSNSETGHVVNVENFGQLISLVKGYGARYNPANDALKVANLEALYKAAGESISALNDRKVQFNNAANLRRQAFEPLRPLATQIVNAFETSGASAEAIAGIRSINRKIQGERASKPQPPKEGELPAKTISASQLSFDNQVNHFELMILACKKEPAYKPNEEGLKIAALEAKLEDLRTANRAMNDVYTHYSGNLVARNRQLYDAAEGLVKMADNVKKYVRSVYKRAAWSMDN